MTTAITTTMPFITILPAAFMILLMSSPGHPIALDVALLRVEVGKHGDRRPYPLDVGFLRCWTQCVDAVANECTARSRSAAQMTIKEPDHHIECIFRLRNICVVKESVKETFPYVEFRFYAELHQLLIRIECGAQLKVARSRDDQRWREFR